VRRASLRSVLFRARRSRLRARADADPCVVDSVVTFTNKAANEMKERLKLLVGPVVVDRLIMGTFHSCACFLRLLRSPTSWS
jgi:superfamily I DNA/RNA helicase